MSLIWPRTYYVFYRASGGYNQGDMGEKREEEGEKNEDDATTRPHFLDCVSDRSIPPG